VVYVFKCALIHILHSHNRSFRLYSCNYFRPIFKNVRAELMPKATANEYRDMQTVLLDIECVLVLGCKAYTVRYIKMALHWQG
jgi:hypothetical protein